MGFLHLLRWATCINLGLRLSQVINGYDFGINAVAANSHNKRCRRRCLRQVFTV
jgi:hypothetical protein